MRFADRGLEAAFIQTNLMALPFPDASVDILYAQGVLHHTDSTAHAIEVVAKKLRPGGRLLFYVYCRKGPIREFTDDYVRAKLQNLSPEEMWQAMLPLTRFGKYLGELNMEIEVLEPIPFLEIPAGRISLQRFFYWHMFKAFYHSAMTLDEMNHVNLDWYAPLNAHRQTPEEVQAWCAAAGLVIEREHLQESGISIVARKQ
jgi:SAM-dependent methyltransferase